MEYKVAALLLLFLLEIVSFGKSLRFACQPNPSQVVDGPNGEVRFTVLTPRVIRIQRAATKSARAFDDRCSFAITNRPV